MQSSCLGFSADVSKSNPGYVFGLCSLTGMV